MISNKSSPLGDGKKQEIFNNKHIVVLYREVTDKDGFVITALITFQIGRVKKDRKIIWKKK